MQWDSVANKCAISLPRVLQSKSLTCIPVYAPQCKFLDNYLGLGLRCMQNTTVFIFVPLGRFPLCPNNSRQSFTQSNHCPFQVPLRTINSSTGQKIRGYWLNDGFSRAHGKMSICVHHNRQLHWIDLGLCMWLSLKTFVKSWASSNQQIKCPPSQQVFSSSVLINACSWSQWLDGQSVAEQSNMHIKLGKCSSTLVRKYISIFIFIKAAWLEWIFSQIFKPR